MKANWPTLPTADGAGVSTAENRSARFSLTGGVDGSKLVLKLAMGVVMPGGAAELSPGGFTEAEPKEKLEADVATGMDLALGGAKEKEDVPLKDVVPTAGFDVAGPREKAEPDGGLEVKEKAAVEAAGAMTWAAAVAELEKVVAGGLIAGAAAGITAEAEGAEVAGGGDETAPALGCLSPSIERGPGGVMSCLAPGF